MSPSRATTVLIAVLDANVLFPFGLRDCLLWTAWAGLYQPRWSAQILAEARQSLLARGHVTEQQADRLFDQMGVAFPEALVVGYEPLIEQMATDPGDRHVAAAAVHAGASLIVTQNLRHFPDAVLRPYRLRAVDVDAFLGELLDTDSVSMLRVTERMAAARRRPARTVSQILGELEWIVPRFCRRIRAILDEE